MTLRLVTATDSYDVPTISVGIYGAPGVGKSSTFFTAEDPFLFAADRGFFRAANRKTTAIMDVWADVQEAAESEQAKAAKTWGFDTGAKLLDLMAADVMRENPKYGSGMALNQKGWGVLKGRFQQFAAFAERSGKSTVWVFHAKEKGSNSKDEALVRPDIAGGSYDILMADLSLVGHLEIGQGGQRILNFNPTDTRIGKNPCGWKPMVVPDFNAEPLFLAKLIQAAKDHFNKQTAENASVAGDVEKLVADIACLTEPEQFAAIEPRIKEQPKMVQAQVRRVFGDALKLHGLRYDSAKKEYQRIEPEARA